MKKLKSDIKVGKFKPVKYYEAKIEAPDSFVKTFVELGKRVITDEQYLNIGITHAIQNAIKRK